MSKKDEEQGLPDTYADSPHLHSGSIEDLIHVPGGPGLVAQAEKDHHELQRLRELHAKRDAVQGAISEQELNQVLGAQTEYDFEDFYYSDNGRQYALDKLQQDGEKLMRQREGKSKSHEDVFMSRQQRRLMDEQHWIEGADSEDE